MVESLETSLEIFDKKLLVTIKTNLEDKNFIDFFYSFFNTSIPSVLKFSRSKEFTICWMSYDELLVICDPQLKNKIFKKFDEYKYKRKILIFDVSDTRTIFKLKGKYSKEIISKGCPKDMSEKSFEKDSFFRSRLGNVAIAFWSLSENSIALMCSKSVSDFTFEWLSHSKNKLNLENIY